MMIAFVTLAVSTARRTPPPPPSLWFTLPMLVVVAVYLAFQVRSRLRRRAAARQVEQAGHASPSPKPTKQWIAWAVILVVAMGLFMFMNDDMRNNTPRAARWQLIFFAVIGVMLAIGLGGLFLVIKLMNRTLRKAQALFEAGDVAGATALLRGEIAKNDPKRSPTAYGVFVTQLATILTASGDRAAGEAVFREAAEREPQHGMWHAALALSAAADGRREEAITLLERAREQSPREAIIRVCLAEQFLATGRTDEAADSLRQADELATAYPAEQRTHRSVIADAIKQMRDKTGDSPRGFAVVANSDAREN